MSMFSSLTRGVGRAATTVGAGISAAAGAMIGGDMAQNQVGNAGVQSGMPQIMQVADRARPVSRPPVTRPPVRRPPVGKPIDSGGTNTTQIGDTNPGSMQAIPAVYRPPAVEKPTQPIWV